MPIEVRHGATPSATVAGAYGGGVLAKRGQVQDQQLAQQQRRSDFVYEMTTRQRAEMERLANAEADMMASDDYTDQEKVELRRRFQAKRAGIEPVERPAPKTPREKFDAKTFRDSQTGAIYPLDADGTPGRPIHEPPAKEPSFQDRIKAVQAATSYATTAEGVVDSTRFDEAMKKMGFGDEPAPAGGDQPAPQGSASPVASPGAGPNDDPDYVPIPRPTTRFLGQHYYPAPTNEAEAIQQVRQYEAQAAEMGAQTTGHFMGAEAAKMAKHMREAGTLTPKVAYEIVQSSGGDMDAKGKRELVDQLKKSGISSKQFTDAARAKVVSDSIMPVMRQTAAALQSGGAQGAMQAHNASIVQSMRELGEAGRLDEYNAPMLLASLDPAAVFRDADRAEVLKNYSAMLKKYGVPMSEHEIEALMGELLGQMLPDAQNMNTVMPDSRR